MIYYLYDITNSNIYLSQSMSPYSNSTTVAPPSTDREDYSFDTTKQVWSKNSTFLTTKKTDDLTTRINQLLTRFDNICNQKVEDTFTAITKNPYSELLIKRYQIKYSTAQRFIATGDTADSDALSLEAGFQGLSVTDFAKLIIKYGDALSSALDTLNIKIDAVRVKMKKVLLVNKDLVTAKTALIKFEALPYTATNADVAAIFPS